jgi:hypothetical protein
VTANTIKRLAGPAYIANSATNIYTQSSLIYDIITLIRIINVTASPVSFTLYVGATGGSSGGTQVEGGGGSIPANTSWPNNEFNLYCKLRLVGAVDFLTGIAGTPSALVITVMGESGVI